MTKLELSPQTVTLFENLTTFFPTSVFIDDDLRIRIECEHIVIGIHQVERYEKDVGFFIDLKGEKISFMYQDVAYAISGDTQLLIQKFLGNSSVKFQNDLLAKNFIQFCVTNAEKLLEWPPSWFGKASHHSIEQLNRHFPDLAEKTRAVHENLTREWATWA